MGFHTGAYATVWEITETGSKFSKIRISTSRKDKESDEYVTDFNGFVSMVGDANKNINLISDALEVVAAAASRSVPVMCQTAMTRRLAASIPILPCSTSRWPMAPRTAASPLESLPRKSSRRASRPLHWQMKSRTMTTRICRSK